MDMISASKITNMTEGKPVRLILKFAAPLIVGNLLQQFYAIVDSIVVGRGVGIAALAAVGSADWLNWFMLWVIQGLTQGFAIMAAQSFGAGDENKLRKSLAMSVYLCTALGVFLTIVGLTAANPVLNLLETPSDIIGGSWEYLQVIYIGILIVTAYNMASCILRALGDSSSPLIAMIIAAVINICLDILFVLVFQWGIRGAAIATIIAQLFSFLYCLYQIWRLPMLKIKKGDWKADFGLCKKLLKLGVPMALSMAVIAVGGMVVQFVVNGQGVNFVAGFTATNKLYGLLECVSLALGFSVSTYVGQNYGAGRIDRIKFGMQKINMVITGIAAVISLCMIGFGRYILKLFISGDASDMAQVESIAYKYLFIMSCFLIILYFVNVYRAAVQGLGGSASSSVSGIIEMIMRVTVALIMPKFFGEASIFFAEPAAWIGSGVYLVACFLWELKRIEKTYK